jgi:hypothetical protein
MRPELEKHVRCSLKEPTIALELPSCEKPEKKPVVTKIEAGETLEIEGPAAEHTGMVEVNRGGHAYAIFAEDLRERATEIDSGS